MVREEFLELLRTDASFREEVRRQVLTEDLLALPAKFEQMAELVGQILIILGEVAGIVQELAEAQEQQGEQIERLIQVQERQGEQTERLIQAQQRTEEELRKLVNWQQGESGRRKGRDFEREVIRRAPFLFQGGQGGSTDEFVVRQRLTDELESVLAEGPVEKEDDPFLADLLWWKGNRVAVVEVSIQVNGYDIIRAAQRAATLRRAGLQALPIVIGDDWTGDEAETLAVTRKVEWKVGPHLSDGFLNFRRAPAT